LHKSTTAILSETLRPAKNTARVVTTNTIPLVERMNNPIVKVLSVGPMIAKVIENIEDGTAVSTMYDDLFAHDNPTNK
jgi:phosphoribosylpyrophosphate synthetase